MLCRDVEQRACPAAGWLSGQLQGPQGSQALPVGFLVLYT